MNLIKNFFKEEEGIATLKVVLIAVILLWLIILFKDWIVQFFKNIIAKISGDGNKILEPIEGN